MGKKHVEWEVFVELADGTIDAMWTVKAPDTQGKVFRRKFAAAKWEYKFPKPPPEFQKEHEFLISDFATGWSGYAGENGKFVPFYRIVKRLKNVSNV